MRLTRYTDYALRILMYVGLRRDKLSPIKDIAEAYGISENHLTKVVHQLGRMGVIETVRGRGGGIRLARPPDRIGIGEIVRRTEEGFALVDCFTGFGCTVAGPCRLQPMLQEALAAFLGVLDRHTLQDLLTHDAGTLASRLKLEPFPARPAGAAAS
jgi:Rrf2 family nitric oxide-sensitive transcriptional repressor